MKLKSKFARTYKIVRLFEMFLNKIDLIIIRINSTGFYIFSKVPSTIYCHARTIRIPQYHCSSWTIRTGRVGNCAYKVEDKKYSLNVVNDDIRADALSISWRWSSGFSKWKTNRTLIFKLQIRFSKYNQDLVPGMMKIAFAKIQ